MKFTVKMPLACHFFQIFKDSKKLHVEFSNLMEIILSFLARDLLILIRKKSLETPSKVQNH
jgi:hypothetical protein